MTAGPYRGAPVSAPADEAPQDRYAPTRIWEGALYPDAPSNAERRAMLVRVTRVYVQSRASDWPVAERRIEVCKRKCAMGVPQWDPMGPDDQEAVLKALTAAMAWLCLGDEQPL
jgi:hypothetical protein